MTIKVKWPSVINEYNYPYIKTINLGNYAGYAIIYFKIPTPEDAIYIGLNGMGNSLFITDRALLWEYVSEKLKIREPDARIMADFINAQFGYEAEQQGVYYEEVVMEGISCGGLNPIIVREDD